MDSLIGYMVALVLSVVGVAGFSTISATGMQNVQTAAAASQMILYNKAVARYVADYGATLATQASANVPVNITTDMLINAQYLPSGFSKTNVFQQTWLAQVLQPTSGGLETLVTTQGGNAISNVIQLSKIAAQIGAEGGYIPYESQGGDSTLTATNAQGSYGGWKLSMAPFTNPGSGHLASLLAYTSATTNDNYLYRVAIPGETQLNAMQTDLSMQDSGGTAHNISGAAAITAQTVTTSGDITTSKNLVASANITAGGDISTSKNMIAGANVTAGGYVVPQGIATQGTACSSNGELGTNGTTGMVCTSGIWQSAGSAWRTVTYRHDANTTTQWNIGVHAFCAIQTSGYVSGSPYVVQQNYGVQNSTWRMEAIETNPSGFAIAFCLDLPGAGL